MAMHGSPGGHGRIEGSHGHGMHGRRGGRIPPPFLMFRHDGMGWLVAPFMFAFLLMILLGELITSPVFLTLLLLSLITGLTIIMIQRQPQEKTKRKRVTHDDEYDSMYYDNKFYEE